MCKSLKNQWYSHQLCSCFIIVISNIGFSYQKQKTFKGKPWFSSRTWAPIMVVSSTKPFFCCYKWGYNSMGWLTSTYWLITVFFGPFIRTLSSSLRLLRAKLSKCKSTSALSDVKDVDSRESQQLFARKRSETMGSGRGFVCSPQSALAQKKRGMPGVQGGHEIYWWTRYVLDLYTSYDI